MTIYKTAYDTTIGNRAVIDKIVESLQEMNITKSLYQNNDGLYNGEELVAYSVDNKFTDTMSVPYFAHPIYYEQKLGGKPIHLLATDVRSLVTTKYTDHGKFSIRNQSEFDLLRARTVLNTIWLLRNPSYLRDISFVPCSMYASWIADNVSRRYALDPKDQMLMAIVAAIFYQTLFIDGDELNEADKLRMVPAIVRATKAPNNMVLDVLDRIPKLSNIHDFCNACKEVLENPRLQDFNAGVLVTVIGNTWFGTNAKEIMPVALEHPPTWIALVYIAFTERTYKKTSIGTLALRYMGNKGENEFVRAFVSLTDAYHSPSMIAE